MIPIKKSLKLSRNHGKKLEKAEASLDDSMDDFIVTRPLRTERKAAKDKSAPVSKLALDQQEANKNKPGLPSPGYSELPSCSGSVSGKTTSFSSFDSKTFSDSEQYETHGSKHSLPNVGQESLPTLRNLQKKEVNPSSSPKLRRTSRRRAVDPSDLSLALALSESLQSANESARKQEEELLLTENLTEVISDLRNEEQTTGVLSHVFQKPIDAPVTKVKRKAKVTAKNKEPTQYTLALRSQTERERLIADRAASILNQEPEDPLKPPKKCFNHSQPISEYIRKHSKDEKSLWQRTSLTETTTVNETDAFYVGALRSVLSPPKKKGGYTNILLHVSQLPGRNSSQIDQEGVSNTQLLLEELAFAAEGGFVEDSSIQDDGNVVSDPAIASVNRLTQDWSNFLDNPSMSDIIIRTKGKNIWAHRLVFAVRFPKILDCVKEAAAGEKCILDWACFSVSSAMKVLRFIYVAAYEHNDEDARQVYRIARRYGMNELIELLPRQYERDSEGSDESDDDSALELDLAAHTSQPSKVSEKELPHADESSKSPEMVIVREKIGTQKKKKQGDLILNSICSVNSPKKKSPHSSFNSMSLAPSQPTKLFPDDHKDCFIEVLNETQGTNESDKSSVTRKTEETSFPCSSTKNRRPVSCAMSASDMDICSSNNTPNNRLAPLSPDMFQETLIESDEEGNSPINSPEEMIDLTQESLDKQSDRSHSPFPNSCEMEDSFNEKSDKDVSMLECSINSGPLQPLPKSPSNCFLQNTSSNQSGASCSRVDPSFINDSVSSWNCYPGGIDDVYHDCLSPVNVKVPSPRLELTEIDREPPAKPSNPSVEDEFPDELDSVFQHIEEPSPYRPTVPSLSVPSRSNQVTDNNTPEQPRHAKKRKIDVTPLPDYQSMDTPLLKQELVKYGLKPFRRPNAVKLLQHIYEELHPLVTDSESSFQDTPERPRVAADRHNKQPTASTSSPTKSSRDGSSYEESESGHSQEDEESLIVMELDREVGCTQSDSPERSVSLKDQLKSFLQKRPDIYKSVLTYEPISFEYLFKEVRKERIRCKAQDLLDWLDEECITCRMKNRNRNRPTNRATEPDNPNITPEKKGATSPKKPLPKARRVAKKLIT